MGINGESGNSDIEEVLNMPEETEGVFHDYGGEDFSQYIDEDQDPYLEAQSYQSTSRRTQREQMVQEHRDRRLRKALEKEAHKRAKSPATESRKGLKEKLVNAFTLERPNKKAQQPPPGVKTSQPGRSIHQLSFMDTKMGQYADSAQMSDYISRDLETKSDLGGGSSKRLSSWAGKDLPSWYNETLSVSTLRRNKKMLDGKFTKSVPNLSDAEKETAFARHRGESHSEFDAEVIKKEKRKGLFSRFKFWKTISRKKAEKKNQLSVSADCIDVPL